MAWSSLINVNLRPVSSWDTTTTPPTPVFVPPLTAAEQVTLNDLQLMVGFGVTMSLAE